MLNAISPVDGRYSTRLAELQEYFSEYALIRKRVYVELRYLIALGKADNKVMKIHDDLDLAEAEKIKEIEKTTNHDVKSVEYYLRDRVPKKAREYVHYGLTSEDVNNLAYSLLVKDFISRTFMLKLEALLIALKKLAQDNMEIPMLAHTHGQPASPTTLGKEFLVFHERLRMQQESLARIRLTGKLNGATGNFNALVAAEPEREWEKFSSDFVSSMGLVPNPITTQIEPHDTLVELFHCIKRINNIIADLDQDMWLYISMDYLALRKKEGEVGSSTMPHKVNPIDFENSEGNIRISNALLLAFESLQVSKMQRDLSDSTVMRNIGVAFAHSVLSIDSTCKGLGKLMANRQRMDKDLEEHPEVLAEAIQTVLRKHGIEGAYEKLKELSRGRSIKLEDLHGFIDSLDLPKSEIARLKKMRPRDYTGSAAMPRPEKRPN